MYDDDNLHPLPRNTRSRSVYCPDLAHRIALEDIEEENGGIGEDEEPDEGPEEEAPAFEFGDAEEEEADADFREGEGDEDLVPVEVVVF